MPAARLPRTELPWERYVFPGGEGVWSRWLARGPVWVAEVIQPPGHVSPRHRHPHDVVYLWLAGTMSMSGEPGGPPVGEAIYGAGDIRCVRRGFIYGPERSGRGGNHKLVVSFGGDPVVELADAAGALDTPDRPPSSEPGWWRARYGEPAGPADVIEVGLRREAGRVLSTTGIHAARVDFRDGRTRVWQHSCDSTTIVVSGRVAIDGEQCGRGDVHWAPAGSLVEVAALGAAAVVVLGPGALAPGFDA
jgi:hypothetical protein